LLLTLFLFSSNKIEFLSYFGREKSPTITTMSSIFPEVRTFVKGLVKNINEGVSLKECFDDDRDAVTMVFGMNDCRNQFTNLLWR